MKKSMLKKILSATVLTSMLFGLTACGGGSNQNAGR